MTYSTLPLTLKRITPPDLEPVSVDEAKLHLRLVTNDEDALVEAYITAAREYAEDFLGRALLTQTWELTTRKFPDNYDEPILVPKAPLQSLTSITYIDNNGASQVMDPTTYSVDTASEPGRIFSVWATPWPVIRDVWNAVVVRFVAGYGGTADLVPRSIRQGILVDTAGLFENRGETGTEFRAAAEALYWPQRVFL